MRSTETGSAGIALQNALRKLYTASVKPTLTGTAPFAREAGTVELVRETTDVIERLLSGPRSQSVPHPSSYHRMFRQALGNRGGKAKSAPAPTKDRAAASPFQPPVPPNGSRSGPASTPCLGSLGVSCEEVSTSAPSWRLSCHRSRAAASGSRFRSCHHSRSLLVV